MSQREVYIHIQLPGSLEVVPAALLRVTKQREGTYVGRFRYGGRYLERPEAIELDPFQLPLGNAVHEFTKLKGIPGAVRDAAPDAWGRRVIEHKLQRGSQKLCVDGAKDSTSWACRTQTLSACPERFFPNAFSSTPSRQQCSEVS